MKFLLKFVLRSNGHFLFYPENFDGVRWQRIIEMYNIIKSGLWKRFSITVS